MEVSARVATLELAETFVIARDSTGVYVNFLHREGEDRVHAAYPGATYRRLLDLKRRWDPSNLFRNNPNIQP